MIVYVHGNIKREHIARFREVSFVFGDNLRREGYGGQAREFRGEPNAVGIYTKVLPSRNSGSYFSDEQYDYFATRMDESFYPLLTAKIIAVPVIDKTAKQTSMGTGLALLDIKAPRLYAHMIDRLEQIAKDRPHIIQSSRDEDWDRLKTIIQLYLRTIK